MESLNIQFREIQRISISEAHYNPLHARLSRYQRI